MSRKIKSEHFKIGLSVLWGFLKENKNQSLIILGLGILTALANGAVPYITGRLFDKILNPNDLINLLGYDIKSFIFYLALLASIQLILLPLDYKRAILQSRISFKGRFDYQAKAYSGLIELPLSFHKKKKVGEITSKIGNAGMGMEVISERLLGDLGTQFLTIFVAIGFLLSINVELALFAFGVVIFYIVASYFLVVRNSGSIQAKLIKGWGMAYGSIHDVVHNVGIVKQSTTEEYEKRNINKNFKKHIYPYWLKMDEVWQSLNTLRGLLVVLLQIVVFIWSITLVQDGVMTIGGLIAFNSYLAMLFAPFTSLMNMWRMIQNGLLDIASVEKILETKPEDYSPKNAKALKEIKGNIKFDHVDYYYEKKKQVLKDINFEVAQGQVVALVGESGVGKSTLIDLLSGYHFPKKGKVEIDGINIKNIDLKFLRSNIAIVPQEVTLFNDTIKKNIAYGNFKRSQEEIEEATRKAHALTFIEKFPRKWRQVVGERGVKLSVGQKQRVAIARAILRDPAILILDEPTSALDAKSEKIIQQSLNELMNNRTTFIVAHRLSTVRKADLILVFEEGQIVERGTHEELIKIENGKYRHLHDLQIGLHD